MADGKRNMKTRLATSRFSCESKNRLTLAFDDNTKCDEADILSTERGASTRPTSVKSEVTTETNLPLGNGGFEMVVEKTYDSQHRSESSCSSSLPVVLPFSNQSYQDTFKETNLFRNYGSSMDSSNSKAFDRSPEEPVTASSESGISAQIASKAIRNEKGGWNSMMISSMAENRCSLMKKKEDKEISGKWDHEITTPEEDAGEVLEETVNMNGFNCTSKTAKGTISDSSMTKPSKNPVKDEDKFSVGFDLNEDFNANVMDDCIQPVDETTSSHRVIHVVAKAGILTGYPVIPLKFEGGWGWKGSAQTSAFRPVSVSHNSVRKTSSKDGPKEEQRFSGFDLNVALEDNDANETQSKVDSKQAKSLIDLNCLYDASIDQFTKPFSTKSQNCPRVDLNLNSDTSSVEKSKNVHCTNTGKQEYDFTSHDYWANLSTMRNLTSSAHVPFMAPNFLHPTESMQREASMQPNLPFIPHTFQPHSYSYKDPFHLGAVPMPYARYYGEHASFNVPHFGRVVYEQSSNTIPASFPKYEDKTGDNLSLSGGRMDNLLLSGGRMEDPRQFQFLARNSPMAERMHQEAWYAASLKRKEPEGGIESYQLGYKQVN